MLLAANMIGEFAESVEIGRVVECEAFVESEAFTVLDLECDVAEIGIE